MKIDYNNKKFTSISNDDNGEVDSKTIFHYCQSGNTVTGTYSGGIIEVGMLIAKVDKNGKLDMRYQHINAQGDIKTGRCLSIPKILSDGRIQLHEKWQWTCDDFSSGESIIKEIND